ncbi:MAG: septum formation protein Maf [Lachnospiraceae bacterium]|nr:septum formation protein Maf [Lachnospiraceae bacterium]
MKLSYKYILASGSPRRKEILSRLGFEYEVRVSDASEEHDIMSPDAIVEELSLRKAKSVAAQCSAKDAGSIIIAADTLVAIYSKVLGKPVDRAQAKEMIKTISGKAHQVYTGVTLIHVPSGKTATFSDRTDVHVRQLTEAEIDEYVNSGEGDDKAGAYAIQGEFGKYISSFEGSRDNVIGFPSELFMTELNKFKEELYYEQ